MTPSREHRPGCSSSTSLAPYERYRTEAARPGGHAVTMAHVHPGLSKVATSIAGFDEISLGGLPRNRTTLVMGGPGTGKSVFALQSLVGAASKHKQPGIFVAF